MILIYEQDLTHYRASFYDFLAKITSEPILILYSTGEPSSYHIFYEKNEKRNFQTKFIKRHWLGKSFYFHNPLYLKLIKFKNVSCVIHRGAIRNISLIPELIFFKIKKIPIIIRGQGYSRNRKFEPNKNLLDFIHYIIINLANIYLCYTCQNKIVLDKHFDSNKIIVAINTLNSNLLNNHYDEIKKIGVNHIKKGLNLKKTKYLIFVGRLAKRKKLDVLLDIYKTAKTTIDDLGLIILGSGPCEHKLKKIVKSENIPDVVFTGSLSPDDITTSKYLFVSDILIIPGWLGLAINHAFFLGVPVIGCITNNSFQGHGPEAEYLKHKENGYIVKNDKPVDYYNAIQFVLNHRDELSINARKFANEYLTIQNMSYSYLEAINKISLKKSN